LLYINFDKNIPVILCERDDDVTYYALFTPCTAACETSVWQ